MTLPALPIPAPLRGSEYDSFAYHTVTKRLPRIGRRVLEENDFPAPVVAALERLLAGIPRRRIRLLRDAAAPDTEQWISYVAPYLDDDWLQVPWFFAETYFYRRILEATGYFHGQHADPFAPHKQQSLAADRDAVRALAARLQASRAAGWPAETLPRLLLASLWSNQGDLSMWPGGAAEQPGYGDAGSAAEHVLVDDRETVAAYLLPASDVRVDILADNAGYELATDLALLDFLLDSGTAATVHLHLKPHPTFVSDATAGDFEQTLAFLAMGDSAAGHTWAARLRKYLDDGRLLLRHHTFWTSPLPGWEMPLSLRQSLTPAHLVISKGDANYRRLLGDRHWAYTAPFDQIVTYFPAPLLAVRTLKSELAAGLAPQQVAHLTATAPGWLTSGQWGIIQSGTLEIS